MFKSGFAYRWKDINNGFNFFFFVSTYVGEHRKDINNKFKVVVEMSRKRMNPH